MLVVDDDTDALVLATRILQGMGYSIDSATNGQDALDKLGARDFDAVLMDVRMPVLDGLEATRRIRSSAFPVGKRDVPVIAMTANAMPGDERVCLDAGMTGYIPKPITADSIRAELAKALPSCVCGERADAGS